MSAMTNYLENQLIDHLFRTATFSKPAALYVGLFTTAPSDSGGGTEVTGGSYARAQLDPADANWQGTHGTTSGASSGTGGATANASTISFPTPSADWGTVTHFALFDASSAGNMLLWGALNASKTINSGDTVSFAAGELDVTFA